ncbi:MAG: hypothetical protein EBR30_25355 [Cytophagia bacterium]|nr:hypothetical protein [Cytophagia bacterium]
MYIEGRKPDTALKGIIFNIIPTLILGMGFTQYFRFKSDDKVTSEKVLLKIPILEFYILMIVVALSLFTSGGIVSIFEGRYQTGTTMLMIGLPVSILLLVAINSNRIWFKDHLIPEIVKKQIEAERADIGAFEYTDNGFIHRGKHKTIAIEWNTVEQVIAYKTDNYTYDTIHLLLSTANGDELSIHEEIAGWFIFKTKLNENLTGVDKLWELKVMSPPFATSVTLVYKKGKDLMGKDGENKTNY